MRYIFVLLMHAGMYDYLPIDAERALEITMRAATVMFITQSDLSREAVKWYFKHFLA